MIEEVGQYKLMHKQMIDKMMMHISMMYYSKMIIYDVCKRCIYYEDDDNDDGGDDDDDDDIKEKQSDHLINVFINDALFDVLYLFMTYF